MTSTPVSVSLWSLDSTSLFPSSTPSVRFRQSPHRRVMPFRSRAPLKLLLHTPMLSRQLPARVTTSRHLSSLSVYSPNKRQHSNGAFDHSLSFGPRPHRIHGLCHLLALVPPDSTARGIGMTVRSCKSRKPSRSARSLVLELPKVADIERV